MILECVFVLTLFGSVQPVGISVEEPIIHTKSNIDSNTLQTMENNSIEGGAEVREYKQGQNFSLSFKSFATMGYRWNITNDYNTTVIRNIDRTFQVADPKVIGGPVSEIFNFEALNEGSTLLKFSNVRGTLENPQEEIVYLIRVTE